jgi:tetratricopeptide (TPR) repeat protein
MWRLDDSHRAYDEAVRRFPKDLVILCGRANVMKELGYFEKALQEYNIVLQLAEDEPFGRDGKADVLFQWGRLDEALAQYLDNIETFPGDSVAYCGAAEALLSLGRESDALAMYNRAVAAFPHSPVPLGSRANALLVVGRLGDAKTAYQEAISRFPSDPIIRNGFANLLKKIGKHDEALQQYDRIAQDHPFDIVSRTARADLLKHLGRVKEAIAAYEELSRRNPRNRRVRHSLAAVLISNGELDKAEQLLPNRDPSTLEEWVAYHVRGMLLMKRRNYAAAERLFRHGLEKCPWHAERPFFKNALTACLIFQERLRPAEQLTGSDSNPIAQVLKIHIFGELGELRMASKSYQRVKDYCPPLLVAVRNELAGRYVLGLGARKSDQWVLDQMTDAVLLRAA